MKAALLPFLVLICSIIVFPHAGLARDSRPIVQLIYFLPRNRQPQPDINVKMDRLIKEVQRGYADIMEGHGFGRKTFQVETDARGNAVVHHIKGQFTDKHYSNLSNVWAFWEEEIDGRFDPSKNIYLIAIDVSSEALGAGEACGLGMSIGNFGRGQAYIPASGPCFNVDLTAHELAHAFGVMHDLRTDAKTVLSNISDPMVTSFCVAEWLDAHVAFNPDQSSSLRHYPIVQMFPPSLASPPNAIRLRFKVADFDRVHQVQLYKKRYDGDPLLLGCKSLNGTSDGIVELVTSDLTVKDRYLHFQMIGTDGTLFTNENYSIDVASVLILARADVNGDGTINIQDLVLVVSRLGQVGKNKADVNSDGTINIQDLVLVAGRLGADAAAPSAWYQTSVGLPTRATVEQWLTQARRLPLTDARSQRGILLLERLLATLTPKETTLLTNYPNPFNPETWIPYQLSEPTEVRLHIYSVKGELVRTLALGHQAAGMYRSKNRAAYWNGRNEQGERVASGIYFYTFTAGDFTATRKLLIRK